MSRSQEGSVPRQPPLQTISSFARAVGLSVSALRSYGENGLLVPADVDERTGYRYYTPSQWQRAIWIRRLRDTGLPLDRIRSMLDSAPEVADRLLDEWVTDSRSRSEAAERIVAELRRSLRASRAAGPQETRARLDADVLATAVRQVVPASGRPGDGTGLDGVLIDISAEGVAVVATNRYLMLARTTLPAVVTGPPARAQIPAEATVDWLYGHATVDLVIARPTDPQWGCPAPKVVLRDPDGTELPIDPAPDRFPSVDQVLEVDAVRVSRVVISRAALVRAVGSPTTAAEDQVQLVTADGGAVLRVGDHRVPARYSGDPVAVELSASAVAVIAAAAVGADMVCEVRANGRPLLWRDPSQPDFAALVMPHA
jgi:DNA polymerase III subunit beta